MNNNKNNYYEDKIEKIKQIVPEIVQDEKINVDEFQKLIKGYETDEDYNYTFNWPGKNDAKKGAYIPTTLTLKPNKDKSKNFEETKNLYIEGDNLNALKILRDSYSNKVDFIYIDPPYNTGNEFVYSDNFDTPYEEYKKTVGIEDSEGKQLTTNNDTSGSKHTNWLNMMYPRLLLSKDFLSDEGVIFISIDDNEYTNLKKMCDEIFGEQNMVADFVWQKKKGGGNDSVHVATEHEYILLYAKNKTELPPFFEEYDESYLKRYKEEDEVGRFYWDTFKRKSGKQYYPITAPDGTVLQYDENGNEISWLRSENRFKKDLNEGEIKFVKGADSWSVHFKQRLPKGKKPRSIIINKGTTSSGSEELLGIFNQNVFDNSKPTTLIKYLISMISKKDAVVLDFFAGSSTTANATMELNAEDGGNRKFIMVQLPEPLKEDSVAYKDGYKNISEISQERIHRAGEKVIEDNPQIKDSLDIGFKSFELTDTNFPQWDENIEIEEITKQLDILNSGVKNEFGSIYEIMILLKIYQLDEKVEEKLPHLYSIGDKNKSLVTITEELSKELYTWINNNHEEFYQVVIYDNALTQEQKLNLIGNLGEKMLTV